MPTKKEQEKSNQIKRSFELISPLGNNTINSYGVNLEVATSAVIVMKLIVPTRNNQLRCCFL